MITEPKSAFSVREIPISASIIQILNKIKHDEEYAIDGERPVDPRTYQNCFKRYIKAAAIKEYNFHVLRHPYVKFMTKNISLRKQKSKPTYKFDSLRFNAFIYTHAEWHFNSYMFITVFFHLADNVC